MRKTLYKYIVNEIWPTFFVCLLVSAFLVVATKMLSLTDLIITRGVPVSRVGRMIAYLMPDIITFALPAASLIAVILAFLRFSVDSEMIALKSAGISVYQMLPPVVTLAGTGLLITVLMTFIGVPWGNRSFKNLIYQIARSNVDLGVKERVFCEPFRHVMFYVNRYSRQDREMTKVFVTDRRNRTITNTIVAQKGRIFFHPTQNIITLRFENGTIFVVENNLQSGRTINFRTYDLNIGMKDIMASLASRKKSPKEMTMKELKEQLKIIPEGKTKHNEIMMELLQKYAVPLAVFLMGIIGMPLGAQLKAKGRSLGIGVSLVVFFVYYLCFAGVGSICEAGVLPPQVGVWIPDLLLLAACIYLLIRVANERPIVPKLGLGSRKGRRR
ncbi:MAG: LPS export ABC transporter permease LptF [Desulfococcus sp. 4484_242]|nr:MAG: LPS export ABC transporter permease LptF [Desulfococcus sp. 4484_242]